jgi:hypothetical protein
MEIRKNDLLDQLRVSFEIEEYFVCIVTITRATRLLVLHRRNGFLLPPVDGTGCLPENGLVGRVRVISQETCSAVEGQTSGVPGVEFSSGLNTPKWVKIMDFSVFLMFSGNKFEIAGI